ncbi:AAA family ATPase [Microbacterium sp. SS28]|uniref:AAA family ATPase n=1 Tax=Microbacterium sp. SS28 TaxID=2919948 RepID=UPI001FAAEB95|nr:AAA family ATPase [Microbacterium sp. SS28]
MRGGLRSWKRGGDSRGIRNALSYAFNGTCDAHHREPLGAEMAARYAEGGGATVTRFTVVGGAIARDELDAIALRHWIEGGNPATGDPRGLVHRSENTDLMLDGTINFPKSYSIAALLAPDLAVEFEALQDRMRDRTVTLWQSQLNARRGHGGSIREDIARLEVVELQHSRSRALDPHIHRHLWLNMKVQGVDGKWSSLDSRVAMKFHTVVNAEGELAARTDPRWIAALAAHGYTLDDDGEIAQLAHVVRPLSRRSNKIEANRMRLIAAWRSEHPSREPGAEDLHHIDALAWAQGRPSKPTHLDEEAWQSRVRAELAEIDPLLLGTLSPARVEMASLADLDRDLLAQMAIADADARSVSSSGRFSEWDVRAGAIRAVSRSRVAVDREMLDELVDDVVARARDDTFDLVPDDAAKPEHIKALMASATVLLKLRVGNRFAGLAAPGALPQHEQMRELARRHAGERGALDDAQLAAASAIAGTGRLVSITGPAGSGKTTLLRVARDALALQRRTLILVAPTKKAAVVAEREVGATASSLHALLADYGWRWGDDPAGSQRWSRMSFGEIDESGRRYLGPERFALRRGDRVVVDEAGMVDLQSADALAAVLEQTGAGLAMIGDPRQAAPVGHAGAMALLTRHADHVVELRSVHRFADPAYGALTLRVRDVSTSAGAVAVADELEAGGHVARVASTDAAQDAMVDAWFERVGRGERISLVVATNDDADAISEAIQQRRVDVGELRTDAIAFGRDGQRLLVGDVIQTRRNDSAAGVENRATWTITWMDDDRLALVNLRDSTERRTIRTEYAAEHAHLAYASTVHGIQGETVDTSIVGPGVDAAGLYVGLTRGRRWNEAIVVAGSRHAARVELAAAMRRGIPEPTIEDSRRGAQIDLSRAARRAVAPEWSGPVAQPGVGRGGLGR